MGVPRPTVVRAAMLLVLPLLASCTGAGGTPAPPAAEQSRAAVQPGATAEVEYVLGYVSPADQKAQSSTAETCLSLPGISEVTHEEPAPPVHRLVVTGEQEDEAFRDCVGAVPGVTLNAVPVRDDLNGLAPPAGADTLVLCMSAFRGPVVGRADCAITRTADRLADVQAALAIAEPTPPPGVVCTIGAGAWDVIWMQDDQVVDRLGIPAATCLSFQDREDGQSYKVSDELLATLGSVHDAEAGTGGAFDGLADPAPAAALCARRYPQDLTAMPLAFDGVVLGISDTDPADAPESPGVPFSDLDVLVLHEYAGQPAERLTVRALVGRPSPDRAVGERLLVATDDPPMLGSCGFTQPYSDSNQQQWADAFG